jgi:hypothetical protein
MTKEQERELFYNTMFDETLKKGIHKDKEREPYSTLEGDFKATFDTAYDVASRLIRSQIEEKVMKLETKDNDNPRGLFTDYVELDKVLKAIKEI